MQLAFKACFFISFVLFSLRVFPQSEVETPSRSELGRLLELALAGGGEEAGKKELLKRLHSISEKAPDMLRSQLSQARRKERLICSLLGSKETGLTASVFFEGKLSEAQKAYEEGDYAQARRLCEAMMTLGVSGSVRVQVRRLLRLSRSREFSKGTLFVELCSKKKFLSPGKALQLVLKLRNRSEAPVEIHFSVGAQLEINYTTVSLSSPISGETLTRRLQVPESRLSLSGGEVWEYEFSLKAQREAASYKIQRVAVGGQLLGVELVSGGRSSIRTLRISPVEFFRGPGGLPEGATHPVEAASSALRSGDAEALLTATVLAAWEGEVDRVFPVLLKGTSQSGDISGMSFFLLKLLTGENHGGNREKWISYYLSRRTLSLRGPLSEL